VLATAAFKRGALDSLQQKQSQQALRLSEQSRGPCGEELFPALSLPASSSPTSKGTREHASSDSLREQKGSASSAALAAYPASNPENGPGPPHPRGRVSALVPESLPAQPRLWPGWRLGRSWNVGRVVLAAKAAVTGENREESFGRRVSSVCRVESPLLALTNPESEMSQPQEGTENSKRSYGTSA